jgi:hypothetical protein
MLFCILFFCINVKVFAADTPAPRFDPASYPDPALLIGLSIEEVFTQLTVPNSIGVSRGLQAWQDDVVLSYTGMELFVARNRVWQIALREFSNIKIGASPALVKNNFGEPASSGNSFMQYNIKNSAWPTALRFSLDKNSRVENIYIYRADF